MSSKPLRGANSLPSLTYRSASDVDLADLERQFNADKDAIKAQGNALNFVVAGDGTFVTVSVKFSSKSFPIGTATSTKTGSAAFLTTYVVVGLGSAYRVTIDTAAARVAEEGEQIWIWVIDTKVPVTEPISGQVDVVFNTKVNAALARLLATLYN